MIMLDLKVLRNQEESVSHLQEKGHSRQRRQSVQRHRDVSHMIFWGKSQSSIIGMWPLNSSKRAPNLNR